MLDFKMSLYFTADTVAEAEELAEKISDYLLDLDEDALRCGMVVSYNRNPIDPDVKED
jgi:hypothetical protein